MMAKTKISGQGMTKRRVRCWDSEFAADWNNSIKENGGIFGAVSSGALKFANRIIEELDDGELPEEDSPLAFAKQIRQLIEVAKIYVEKGDADLAARMAFDAGILWERARLKWAWEDFALSGERYKRKSDEGRAKRLGDVAEHTNQVIHEMEKLILGGRNLSAAAAAKIVANRGIGTSAGANRAAWQRKKRRDRNL